MTYKPKPIDVEKHGMCGVIVDVNESADTVTLRVHSREAAAAKMGMWFVLSYVQTEKTE